MTDEEGILFALFILTALFAMYQRYRIIKLRRTIENIALQSALPVSPAAAAAREASPPALDKELETVKRRLQVLERIATDGSPTLEREFDDLRRS
ncbi:MAG: hypothetical protein M3Q83_00545 [Pseudomonadota bacterium]|nr:hypothetical protein [Pseudomonadota bacterium]